MKTKRTIFITILTLGFAIQASAQFYFGGAGGVNISKFKIDDANEPVAENASIRQVAAGAILGVTLSNHLSLHATPMYIKKGADVTPEADDPVFTASASYLEVPLFLKIELGERVRPYLIAGPAFGFRLDSETTVDINGVEFVADLDDITEKTDWGVGLGAGLSFPVSRLSFFVEGRYALGLKDVLQDGPVQFKAGDVVIDDQIEVDGKVKNQGVQVMIGAMLPLGN